VDYWRHVLTDTLAPYEISKVGDNLRSQIRHAEIGQVAVLDVKVSAMEVSRTPDLIRNSDHGLLKIDLAVGGRAVFAQEDRESMPIPGEFLLMDLSRPSRVAIEQWQKGSAVIFPGALLPLRRDDIRKLTAVRFSPKDPYAALVTGLVTQLTTHLDAFEPTRDTRIGTAFLDLLSLAVAARLGRVGTVPAETRQNAMTFRIRAFIERRLGDPELSPAMIAAAHHMSVRALHKLYEAEEQPVAASIRRRRLERCRQDLLDPGLSTRPVRAVGARWGFQDAAAFSRAFRAAYGLPPSEYRAVHVAAGFGEELAG